MVGVHARRESWSACGCREEPGAERKAWSTKEREAGVSAVWVENKEVLGLCDEDVSWEMGTRSGVVLSSTEGMVRVTDVVTVGVGVGFEEGDAAEGVSRKPSSSRMIRRCSCFFCFRDILCFDEVFVFFCFSLSGVAVLVVGVGVVVGVVVVVGAG